MLSTPVSTVLRVDPIPKPCRGQKYVITLSRNPHDLLLQWLSGAGLDEQWEMGLQSSAGRAKEAVKGLINDHITLKGTQSCSNISLPTSDGFIYASNPNLNCGVFRFIQFESDFVCSGSQWWPPIEAWACTNDGKAQRASYSNHS